MSTSSHTKLKKHKKHSKEKKKKGNRVGSEKHNGEAKSSLPFYGQTAYGSSVSFSDLKDAKDCAVDQYDEPSPRNDGELYNRYKNYLAPENVNDTEAKREKFRLALFKAALTGDDETLGTLIYIIRENVEKTGMTLLNFREEGNETLLHQAVLFSHHKCIDLIIKECPDLIYEKKTLEGNHKGHSHMKYQGQTALHIAVARKDLAATEMLLSCSDKDRNDNTRNDRKMSLLHARVMGSDFTNTCMEHELPLTIAAWNAQKDMIRILLKHGAQRDAKNSKRDTVFHTLVKLCAQPGAKENKNRLNELKHIFHFLLEQDNVSDIPELQGTAANEDTRKAHIGAYFLSLRDNQDLTPITLAAKEGAQDIFSSIINIQSVYKFLDDTDGVSDINLYDVTEIDSAVRYNDKTSSMERIPFHKPDDAFAFMEISPIKEMVHFKWNKYKRYFYSWAMLHLLLITGITICCAHRPIYYYAHLNESYTNTTLLELPVTSFQNAYSRDIDYIRASVELLFICVCLILLCFELYEIFVHGHIPQIVEPLDNGPYRVIFLLFTISAVITFFCRMLKYEAEEVPMVVMLVTGWYFMLFFTRTFKKFSFFTVMIQKVVFGDLFRFSVVFLILLLAFSSAMFIAFQNASYTPSDFNSFVNSMFSLFKLALGLIDINVLGEARKPWLATIIFLVFVILAYILLMNMLIALLSETCSVVAKNKITQWKLQRLSVILLIERRLPKKWRVCSGTPKYVKTHSKFPGEARIIDLVKQSALHGMAFFHLRPRQRRYYQKVKAQTTQNNVYVQALNVITSTFLDNSFSPNAASGLRQRKSGGKSGNLTPDGNASQEVANRWKNKTRNISMSSDKAAMKSQRNDLISTLPGLMDTSGMQSGTLNFDNAAPRPPDSTKSIKKMKKTEDQVSFEAGILRHSSDIEEQVTPTPRKDDVRHRKKAHAQPKTKLKEPKEKPVKIKRRNDITTRQDMLSTIPHAEDTLTSQTVAELTKWSSSGEHNDSVFDEEAPLTTPYIDRENLQRCTADVVNEMEEKKLDLVSHQKETDSSMKYQTGDANIYNQVLPKVVVVKSDDTSSSFSEISERLDNENPEKETYPNDQTLSY